MNAYWLSLLTLCIPFRGVADPIEDFSREQAEQIVTFVEANPLIIQHCDCCDSGTATLMMVSSLTIEKLESDSTRYTVLYMATPMVEMNYQKSKEAKSLALSASMLPIDGYISANYTFAHAGKSSAKTLGAILGIYANSCIGEIYYPLPKDVPAFELGNFDYNAWYAKHTVGLRLQSIVDYYRFFELSPYPFKESNGKWLAPSPYEEGEMLEASVDVKNQYMSIDEDGYSAQYALFKSTTGVTYLLQCISEFDGAFQYSSLKCFVYQGNWKDVTADILPNIDLPLFAKPSARLPEELYNISVYYSLQPKKDGSSIRAFLLTEYAKSECTEGDNKEACNLLKLFQYQSLDLMFNPDGKGVFTIVSKK